MKKYDVMFFDLDGTLFDTALDLAYAMNQLLAQYGRQAVNYTQFRYQVSGGTNAMLRHAFAINDNHPDFPHLREQFLQIYRFNITSYTQPFAGVNQVLEYLDKNYIRWGIVTNKPEALTQPLLDHFDLTRRSCCVISGDTLKTCKPNPEPLLYACQLAACPPSRAVYMGDTKGDMVAAKAAGMYSIGVTWGYHPIDSQPHQWGADRLIDSPQQIIDWLLTSDSPP